jgi:hypothetical protein
VSLHLRKEDAKSPGKSTVKGLEKLLQRSKQRKEIREEILTLEESKYDQKEPGKKTMCTR